MRSFLTVEEKLLELSRWVSEMYVEPSGELHVRFFGAESVLPNSKHLEFSLFLFNPREQRLAEAVRAASVK